MSRRTQLALWLLIGGPIAVFSVWAVADNPRLYVVTMMNSLTLASLYFIVASGFTLVFGLMRNVNLAHGSLYLLGGYVAFIVAERTGWWVLAVAAGFTAAALAGLLTGSTDVPAVVLAAVVHGELLTLAPFGSADGVVGRAAYRLTLVARGLDPKSVSVPEVGHLELGREYDAALAGYRSGDVAGWLRHCCAAVGLGAREGLAVCEAILRS